MLLFVFLMLLIGILCIRAVSRGFKEAAVEDERRRLAEEREVMMEMRRMAQRRQKVWSLMDAAYISFNRRTERPQQFLLKEKKDEAVDAWSGFSPAQIGAAFNEFMRQTRING